MYNEREYGGKAKLQRFTVNDTDDGEETEDEALPNKGKRPKLKSCFVTVHPSWIDLIHHCSFFQPATQQEESLCGYFRTVEFLLNSSYR